MKSKMDFVKIIETQPDDQWVTERLVQAFKFSGMPLKKPLFCPVGWAAAESGCIDKETGMQHQITWGYVRWMRETFGFTNDEVCEITEHNDKAKDHQDAVKRIREYVESLV
jgi:hypothetical protein